ncbi:transcription elongation factor Elf1 like-domain-containing protein [Pelagophyceae sp. CCMP2097]|nr:transcription elongation factor Elf1 like-domain-containing protein [Pelagophyceae sp. CCMP2097]
MAKKKTKAKTVVKKRPTMTTHFKCPFCNHEGAVEAKLDYEQEVGSLECRVCAATYSASIHYLSEPVDVFSEWIDHCEAEATEAKNEGEYGYDEGDDEAEAEKDAGGRRVRQRLD